MSQSLVFNHIHIVFSTKNRYPFLNDNSLQNELHKHIKQCSVLNHSYIEEINSHLDHIHILVNLSKNISISRYLWSIKRDSSKWIKEYEKRFKNFFWQRGYGAFTVGHREIQYVKQYILDQKKHHERKSFKEEFIELLCEHGIKYDEKFLWD